MELPLVGQLAAWSSVLPAAAGWIRHRHHDRVMHLFTFCCVIAALNIILEVALARLGIHNLFLFDIYALVSVLLLYAMYRKAASSGRVRGILNATVLLYVLSWGVLKFIVNTNASLNAPIAMTTSFWFVLASVIMLQHLMSSSTRPLTETPTFWVFTGSIIYYAGTFVIMGLSNQLLELGFTYFNIAWHVNWILTIGANLIYTKGFLCRSQG